MISTVDVGNILGVTASTILIVDVGNIVDSDLISVKSVVFVAVTAAVIPEVVSSSSTAIIKTMSSTQGMNSSHTSIPLI